MTTEQAAKLFKKEAERLRAMGHWAAAHDWQRRASEIRNLASLAENLRRRDPGAR